MPSSVIGSYSGDAAEFDGEASRSCPLDQLRLSERSRHAVRRVTFPDGAYLEIDDAAAFERHEACADPDQLCLPLSIS